jgi:hypothetical protein
MIIAGPALILIIKALAAAIGTAATITVLFLNIAQIIDWFKPRRTNISAVDKAKIYFTLMDRLAAHDYKVVQGVFDRRTQQLGDARAVNAKGIDAQLRGYHRHHELVTYQ